MRRVSMGPPLRIGAMSGAIVLLANIAVSLAIESNGLLRWLAAPAVGLLAAAAAVVFQRPPEPRSALDEVILGPPPRQWLWGNARIGSQTIVGALVTALLVIGVGGVAVSSATRYGMAWVTGNEHGPNRLISPVTARTHGLTVTVSRVEQTPHFTRVTVTVRNGSGTPVSLPIDGGNCELIAASGARQSAQPFRSDWHESVDHDAERTGVLIFGGHLPASATRARIAFAHLFAPTPEAPVRVIVSNLQLMPG